MSAVGSDKTVTIKKTLIYLNEYHKSKYIIKAESNRVCVTCSDEIMYSELANIITKESHNTDNNMYIDFRQQSQRF